MTDRPRVVVTRRLPEAVEARLARDYDAVLNTEDVLLDADALLARAADADALLVCPTDRVDAALIERLPARLRAIATFSVGVDHVDLAAARARGLVVTNTPDVLTDATADIAMLLLLAAARRAYSAEAMLRAGRWRAWGPAEERGTHVTGKRLAILGLGRIGRAMAARARGFRMQIHYHSRNPVPEEDALGATHHADPEAMLGIADFLSFHCPLTPQTKGFLDARRIALLPDGAIVVNTARGPIVDDDALIAALTAGKLAGAGLDVFTGEPALDPRYLGLPMVTLLPHVGSATHETRDAMGFMALDNLDAVFAGTPPSNPVG